MTELTITDVPVVGILCYMAFIFLVILFVHLDNRWDRNKNRRRLPGRSFTVKEMRNYINKPSDDEQISRG